MIIYKDLRNWPMVITFYLIDVLLISFLILLWFSAYSIILFLAPFTLESSSIFLAIFSNFFFLIVMKDLNSSLCFITSRIRLFSFCFKFGNLRLVASPWGVESCEGFLKKSLFYSFKSELFFLTHLRVFWSFPLESQLIYQVRQG